MSLPVHPGLNTSLVTKLLLFAFSELGTKALNRMNMSDFQFWNAILHT